MKNEIGMQHSAAYRLDKLPIKSPASPAEWQPAGPTAIRQAIKYYK